MKLYKPTVAEKKKFDKILKSLTPKMAAYREYRILVDEFLDQYSTLPWKKSLPIKNFKVVKSKLFKREFLVGYATKTWINEVAPGCNAIATTSIKLGGLESPPIVLVPAQYKINQTEENLSILEHEFVHICQAINGKFPSDFNEKSKDLIGIYIKNCQAEYQANYLQLTKWPYLFPVETGLSLNEWCVLRGITQSLEFFLQAGIQGNFSEKRLLAVLKALPEISSSTLKKSDLDELRISSLLKYPESLVQKSLAILSLQSSEITESAVFEKLVIWSHKTRS